MHFTAASDHVLLLSRIHQLYFCKQDFTCTQLKFFIVFTRYSTSWCLDQTGNFWQHTKWFPSLIYSLFILFALMLYITSIAGSVVVIISRVLLGSVRMLFAPSNKKFKGQILSLRRSTSASLSSFSPESPPEAIIGPIILDGLDGGAPGGHGAGHDLDLASQCVGNRGEKRKNWNLESHNQSQRPADEMDFQGKMMWL